MQLRNRNVDVTRRRLIRCARRRQRQRRWGLSCGPERPRRFGRPDRPGRLCQRHQPGTAPRVVTDDTDEDRAAITGIVNQISAYPLDEFDRIAKITDWDDVPSFPEPEVEGETAWVVADEFFGRLPDVMDAVPPMPGEEALYASIRQVLDTADHDPEVKKALVEVAVKTTLAGAG